MATSDVTAWNDSRVMPLANESLSVDYTTWYLVMGCDLLLEYEEEYLEDELSPTVFVVEIELSYL